MFEAALSRLKNSCSVSAMIARARPLLFLLLAFALLFAQQGAARHALSHLAEAHPQSQQGKHLPHSSACDKCVVYADIGGVVAASEHLVPPSLIAVAPLEPSRATFLAQLLSNYRSRAPPSLV